MQRDCPSKRTINATTDGGYASASDIEEKILLQLTFQVPMTVLRRFLVSGFIRLPTEGYTQGGRF
jgi:hypothetical protein